MINFFHETQVLNSFTQSLTKVPGITAIVLGGSRARGTHHPDSDFDIGLYYDPKLPFVRDSLLKVVRNFDQRGNGITLTEPGEWGPWINGGGWLQIEGKSVDLLYRDKERIVQTISHCLAGEITMDYQAGHPHGFLSSIYLSEIFHCKILSDPEGFIANLKKEADAFPEPLQKAIITKFLWEAEFSLRLAEKGIPYNDTSYVSGCLYRTVSCLNQVLFALNREYFLNEKKAVAIIGSFEIHPDRYEERVSDCFSQLSKQNLKHAIASMTCLYEETSAFINDT